MTDDNISPEERLFRVIQEDKKSSAAAKNADPAPGKTAAGALRQGAGPGGGKAAGWRNFFIGGLNGPKTTLASVLSVRGRDAVKQIFSGGIDLNILNKIFIAVLAGLAVIIGQQAFYKKLRIEELMAVVSRITFKAPAPKAIEDFQPVAYYLDQARQRNIFRPAIEVEKAVIIPLEPAPPQPKLQDMVRGLKMVGIAWGASPKAMIKDETTQEIYFLREKELIGKTRIEVRMILRDRVIVGYEQEEMEL